MEKEKQKKHEKELKEKSKKEAEKAKEAAEKEARLKDGEETAVIKSKFVS
jgi:hypothetical protein